MATIHIESHKNKEDLSRFVEEGIARRLQLHGESQDLKSYIQSSIEAKAGGMFLWANLMLEILKWQTTEEDIRASLDTAPTGIDDMITEMLKVYSSMLMGREVEEFNTILAWLSCACRPLMLAEMDAVLRRLSPTASKVLSLENKIRTTYSTLLDVIRDDGLSTATLQAQQVSAHRASIPETTTVTFAHASISEYFRKGAGKFSKRKTATPVGVIRLEAEISLLRTTLQVFVEPGEGAWLDTSTALQPYARQSWFEHLRKVYELQDLSNLESKSITQQTSDKVIRTEVLALLNNFLDKQDVVCRWSYNVPWSFYDSSKVTFLAEFIASMDDIDAKHLPTPSVTWAIDCLKEPQAIFRRVAGIHAKEGLHGDWLVQPALTVVAQIRALIEDDDTLDTLPEKLSPDTIVKAAHWAGLERNASWNRKLAICLRNCGHAVESMSYFERALELDYNLVEARTGLATAYRNQGYATNVIDLELTNVNILIRSIEATVARGENVAALCKKLCISYQIIARTHHHSGSKETAMKYYRKAAETTEIQEWAVMSYLVLLAESIEDGRWLETHDLFRSLQSSKDAEGNNRLTQYIQDNMWPDGQPVEFFTMAATAAKRTGTLGWLAQAYEAAIAMASRRSHLSVLVLKLSLARLYSEYDHEFVKAEFLIDEIVAIASIPHSVPIHDLEKCKKVIAQDFCCSAVRRALEAGKEDSEDLQLRKVSDLFRAGIRPLDMEEKVLRGEDTILYLALLQRLAGSIEDAISTLRPYWAACLNMLEKFGAHKKVGTWMFGVSLIALGFSDDGLVFIQQVQAESGWRCNGCRIVLEGDHSAYICRYCFWFFCQACYPKLEEPQLTRFCLAGHRCLIINPTLATKIQGHVRHRGAEMRLEECVKLMSAKWGVATINT